MTTASRTKTTTSRSNIGFWLALGFILLASMLPPPAPAAEQPSQQGNECRVDVSPVGSEVFLLPCSKVEPSVYPMVWFWEGQDV